MATRKYNMNFVEMNLSNPAPFSNKTLVRIEDYLQSIDSRDIVFFPYKNDDRTNESIDLRKVIGHNRDSGDFSTWGNALKKVRALQYNIEKSIDNSDYYLSTEFKEDLSFIKINSDLFLNEGQNRAILSRFFHHFNNTSPLLERVSVIKQRIDYKYMDINHRVELLRIIYPKLDLRLTYTENENENCLRVENVNSPYSPICHFKRAEVKKFLNDLANPSLMKKISGNKAYRFISFKRCLRALMKNWLP